VEYQLQDLIDVSLLQRMLNRLNDLYRFPSSIKDIHGNVLAETAWEDICNRFKCTPLKEDEEQIPIAQFSSNSAGERNSTLIYRCQHGMIDCVTPIIIEGMHLGNFYAGQIFIEKPEIEFFKDMAQKNGLEEKPYLEAIEKIPVWTNDQLEKYLGVMQSMMDILTSMGSKNLKDIEIRKKNDEREDRFRQIFNSAADAIILADIETGIIVDANYAASKLLGKPVAEIIGLHQSKLHPERTKQYTSETFNFHAEVGDKIGEIPSVENLIIRNDGREIPVEILASTIRLNGKRYLQGIFRDISERKRIEAELIANEEKHRTLTENLPDIISRFDRNLRHIYVNRVVEKITGLPSSDFLGKTNEDLLMPAENVNLWNKNLKNVFDSGKQQNFEFTYRSGNSSSYFSTLLVPEFDKEGKVVSVLSVARDITGLKKIKQRLRIQRDISILLSAKRNLEEALKLLLDFSMELDGIDSGGIYLVDQFSGYLNLVVHCGLSDQFIQKALSFPPDSVHAEIVNSGISYFDGYADILDQNISSVIQENIHATAIIPVMYQGKAIACFNLASHLLDEIPIEDRLVMESVASVLGDTILRIRTEDQLKESEIKYKLAFQTSPDSININTVDGIYVDINEGFTAIMGYTKEEIIGSSSLDKNIWVYPEDRERLVSELKEYGMIKNLESEFKAKDGTTKTALMSANLITINNVPHILSITRDITERKNAENELRVAKEKAEESNRLKTAFLANLSHELRTPMNGILGFTELLDDDTLTAEERREYINVINDSGHSLLEVITNLMDISKIDSRQIETRVRSFNLNNLLNELMNWFKSERIIRDKSHLKIELLKAFPDGESIISSDPGKIRHILSLLLHNAAKFTTEGFIYFGYSVQDQKIRFFVQDSGKGIPKIKHEAIFERFRQEEETLSRKHGGVGLGLSIARELVVLLGGTIHVDSEPGKGSTFWFEISL